MSSDNSATSAACKAATSLTRCAHGDADIGPRQRGGVVHPVADKGHLSILRQFAHQPDLVFRQKIGMDILASSPSSAAIRKRC